MEGLQRWCFMRLLLDQPVRYYPLLSPLPCSSRLPSLPLPPPLLTLFLQGLGVAIFRAFPANAALFLGYELARELLD